MKKISLPKLIIVIILKLLSISAIILGLYLFFITPRTVLCYDCNLDFQWINPFKSYEIEDASLNLIRSSGLLIILFGISLFFGGIYISKRKKWTGLLSLIFFLLILCSFLLPNGPKPSPISTITNESISDWQTHQFYNFQIAVPSNWERDNTNEPRDYSLKSLDYRKKIIELEIGKGYNVVVVNGIVIYVGFWPVGYGKEVENPKAQNIEFHGKEATLYKEFNYYDEGSDSPESWLELKFITNNMKVTIALAASGKYNKEDLENFFNQVLSTFKFTQ